MIFQEHAIRKSNRHQAGTGSLSINPIGFSCAAAASNDRFAFRSPLRLPEYDNSPTFR
jgi:hypothetical protein